MTVTSLPQSTNGTKPTHGTRAGKVVPLLGPKIDHLLELRGLIRRAQDEERQMTAEIVSAMAAAGVTRLQGHQAAALLDQRINLTPDPARFLAATGAAGYAAVSVGVTAARRLMGADDLAAISETTTSPVLRVEPLAPAAA
jgi:hypothetical protein